MKRGRRSEAIAAEVTSQLLAILRRQDREIELAIAACLISGKGGIDVWVWVDDNSTVQQEIRFNAGYECGVIIRHSAGLRPPKGEQ